MGNGLFHIPNGGDGIFFSDLIYLAAVALRYKLEGNGVKFQEALQKIRASTLNKLNHQQFNLHLISEDWHQGFGTLDALLAAGDMQIVYELHGSVRNRIRYQDFYTHPRYKQILSQYGLDQESLSTLVVPPLSF